MKQFLAIGMVWAACAAGLGCARVQAQTVVYRKGFITTMDPTMPRASAIMVKDGRIVAIGGESIAQGAIVEGATVIDLGGKAVLPGLIDAHGHMAGLGSFGMGVLELSGAKTFDDVVAAAARAAKEKPAGAWVLGGRWDHESWQSAEMVVGPKRLPTHGALSGEVPDHPVWLRRVDGHAGIANAAAMRLAGIDAKTASPAGGEILKDDDGEPTGVLVDNAMSLIEAKIPAEARGKPEDLLLKAQELCLSVGLTGVHDAGVAPAEVALYKRLAAEGKLKIRSYLMVSGPYAMKWFDEHAPESGDRVSVRAAKLYMDGAMGSRGAWLIEPYADRPEDQYGQPYTGLSVSDPGLIEAVAKHAIEKGYQVCTHAIGDRANREVLDAYARAWKAKGGDAGAEPRHRFRIEHAQLLAPSDLHRFGQLGVIASMQPTHCTSDMRWVEARVGPQRAKGAYAWKGLLGAGATLAFGSDFPVESHNPFLGIYAAVTRQDGEGKPAGGWMPQEKLTREETVRAFTLGAAAAEFGEEQKGSLAVGKLADFIVVDRDIFSCPAADIREAKVVRTVIGGETVWERK